MTTTKLGICCATNMVSLAIIRDKLIISEVVLMREKVDDLIVLMDQILIQAGVSSENIDEVVVVSGPGSYAGLRTSLTVAKTFALVREIPLKTVQTLELMAYQVRYFQGLIAVVMGSRRDEVNFGLFGGGSALNPLIPCQPVRKNLLFSKLSSVQRDILIVGDLREIPSELQKWYQSVVPKASEAIALSETMSVKTQEEVIPFYAYPVNVTPGKAKR